ncbi:hypothetical protein ACIBEJ_34790 [Nonomuraea sp. NPDC050790]|uniref:hypothetical protein n=1 Tax=Nonomuraea sp. NPDC050790 TaxID=3364371 RepID=UPI00378B747C
MIRRFWSWFVDDRDTLRESTVRLSDELDRLTPRQCSELFAVAPAFWVAANQVAACVGELTPSQTPPK